MLFAYLELNPIVIFPDPVLSLAVPHLFRLRPFHISVALPACWMGGLLFFSLRILLLVFRRSDEMGTLLCYGVKRRVKVCHT